MGGDARFAASALAGLIAVMALSSACADAAELDGKAVSVAAKAINFASPKPQAGAKITIIGNAAGMSDVKAAFSAFAVTSDDSNGAYAVFVATAEDAKAAGRTLTIGPVACAEAGACVLGIDTTGKLTIVISSAAAAAAGIDFDPNFKLMTRVR